MSASRFNVQIEGRSFQVEIEDLHARPVVVTVDGERFEVTPETGTSDTSHVAATLPTNLPDSAAHPVPHSGNGTSPHGSSGHAASRAVHGSAAGEVRAPLPGTVLSVAVAPGDRVEVGQELCTLEAMKMKNLIRATYAGTVIEVPVAPGQTVKHNELLLRCVRHAD